MLDKLKAFWIRLTSTVKILLIVGLIVLLGMGGCRIIRGSINSRIAKVEAKLSVAEAQAKTANAVALAADKARMQAVAEATARIADADKRLAALARANAKINADLEAEREKTKAMPQEKLAESLGQYIGLSNISALASGSFTLTRLGAENTRGIFLTSTALADKLVNCESAREQDAVKLTALGSKLGSTTSALSACKTARLSDADVIKLLQKDVSFWKSKNRWAWLKGGVPALAMGIAAGYLIFRK